MLGKDIDGVSFRIDQFGPQTIIVFTDEVVHHIFFNQPDIGPVFDMLDQGFHDFPAGGIPAGVQDSAGGVTAFTGPHDVSLFIKVKRNTEFNEVFQVFLGFIDQFLDGIHIV
jgi:hypothetical protein